MRTTLLFLLLASTAAPSLAAAAADPDEGENRRERREARSESDERPQRAERPQRSERADRLQRAEREAPPAIRPDRAPREDRAVRVERDREPAPVRVERDRRPAPVMIEREQRGDDRARRERPSRARGDETPVRVERDRETRTDSPSSIEERNLRRAPVARTPREREGRRLERPDREGPTPPLVSRVPREGTQPPAPQSRRPDRDSNRHWRGDWRNDRRHDWRGWRERNRSRFRLGIYFDPFGWGYQPYQIGWRMWPHYYRSSYWLSDPWSYRLPYAPDGYRWVRYYDDAVLVDLWDGRVVDVIHNFFW